MKKIAIGICVLTITTSIFSQTKTTVHTTTTSHNSTTASVLKNATDSFSYAIGTTIGKNLKQTGIDSLNYSDFQKGLSDAMRNKTTLITDQDAMMMIQQKMQMYMSKKLDAEKEKAYAFLEANKKRPGVTTLPDGLQYEVITKGNDTTAKPTAKDTVVANYVGTLIDGKEFDNSYKRGQPITIPVTGVIKGWTEALQLMHVGDKWKVYIPSDLGYGDRGAGADIPGGAALVFEMELLQIKPAATK